MSQIWSHSKASTNNLFIFVFPLHLIYFTQRKMLYSTICTFYVYKMYARGAMVKWFKWKYHRKQQKCIYIKWWTSAKQKQQVKKSKVLMIRWFSVYVCGVVFYKSFQLFSFETESLKHVHVHITYMFENWLKITFFFDRYLGLRQMFCGK